MLTLHPQRNVLRHTEKRCTRHTSRSTAFAGRQASNGKRTQGQSVPSHRAPVRTGEGLEGKKGELSERGNVSHAMRTDHLNTQISTPRFGESPTANGPSKVERAREPRMVQLRYQTAHRTPRQRALTAPGPGLLPSCTTLAHPPSFPTSPEHLPHPDRVECLRTTPPRHVDRFALHR